jgi:hypothetical protein
MVNLNLVSQDNFNAKFAPEDVVVLGHSLGAIGARYFVDTRRDGYNEVSLGKMDLTASFPPADTPKCKVISGPGNVWSLPQWR